MGEWEGLSDEFIEWGNTILGQVHSQAYELMDVIKPLRELYELNRMVKHSDEKIADIALLANLIIRFVENEDMREFERRYDEMYNDDNTLVVHYLQHVRLIYEKAMELYIRGELILWQPVKGAVLVNGK